MLKEILVAATLTTSTSKFGYLVEKHVQELFRQGYALRMEESDFDHGHVILGKQNSLYGPIDKMLPHTRFILYHTDEFPGGRSDHKPEDHRKKPRSIIGLPDGTIVPAGDLIDLSKIKTSRYLNHGSVLSDDIHNQIRGLQVTPFYDFELVKSPDGCFEAGGEKFDVVFQNWMDNNVEKKVIDCR